VGLVEDRLRQAGLSLPEVFSGPPGFDRKFDLVRRAGNVGYISGHVPIDGSQPLFTGKVGDTVTLEQGYDAARATGLSILASLKQELGDLDSVTGWVKALGFVNAAPGFVRTAGVIDGFTDLILELWGDAGRHARSAIGVAELPFNVPVEVEAIVELAPLGEGPGR
jgi:enamine deaminase RidA (YjgF/YER057c/UK114 family)